MNRAIEWTLIALGILGLYWYFWYQSPGAPVALASPKDAARDFDIAAWLDDPTYYLRSNAPKTDVGTIAVPASQTQVNQSVTSGDTVFVSNFTTLVNRFGDTLAANAANLLSALPRGA